jgi:hypothetical protein
VLHDKKVDELYESYKNHGVLSTRRSSSITILVEDDHYEVNEAAALVHDPELYAIGDLPLIRRTPKAPKEGIPAFSGQHRIKAAERLRGERAAEVLKLERRVTSLSKLLERAKKAASKDAGDVEAAAAVRHNMSLFQEAEQILASAKRSLEETQFWTVHLLSASEPSFYLRMSAVRSMCHRGDS